MDSSSEWHTNRLGGNANKELLCSSNLSAVRQQVINNSLDKDTYEQSAR